MIVSTLAIWPRFTSRLSNNPTRVPSDKHWKRRRPLNRHRRHSSAFPILSGYTQDLIIMLVVWIEDITQTGEWLLPHFSCFLFSIPHFRQIVTTILEFVVTQRKLQIMYKTISKRQCGIPAAR